MGRFGFGVGTEAATGTLLVQAAGYRPSYPGQQGPFDLYAAHGEIDVQIASRTELVIPLWREASISGTVRDASGQALAGVEVSVLARTYTGAGWRWIQPRARVERTDDRGLYRMDQLPPGSYIVAVRRSTTDSQTTFFPSSSDVAGAAVLSLDLATDAMADVTIGESHHLVGRLSGLIDGPPAVVSGLKVRLALLDPTGQTVTPTDLTTETLRDGRFAFSNVPLGRYRLSTWVFPTSERMYTVKGDFFRAITFNGPRPGVELPPRPDEPTWVGELDVEIDERGPADVVVPLRMGATISGRIVFDGRSVAPTNAKLLTVPVEVRPADGRDLGAFPQGRIEQDGTFRSVGLPAGDYAIRVEPNAAGFAGWSMASIRVQGRETLGASYHVATADVSEMVITLSDLPTMISGTVRGPSVAPQPVARVIAFPQAPELRAHFLVFPETRLVRQAFVDSGGRFQLSIPPGDYYVAALSGDLPEFWMAPDWLERIVSGAARVSVRLGQTQQVPLIAVAAPK